MFVFDYDNYKDYLKILLAPRGETRGSRSKLAERLGCNVGFVSKVINGDYDFGLEHAAEICSFLNLLGPEKDYFLLLVHYQKAGSVKLKQYYKSKIDEIIVKRKEIKSRVKSTTELKKESYQIYFGNWIYAAIHMALSIPEYQTKEALKNRLSLTDEQLNEGITFLENNGLIISSEDGKYSTGPTRIHLDRSSPLINQHHVNWRIQAMKSLSLLKKDNLNYSGVLTMSKADMKKVKNELMNALEKVEVILKPSKDEEICCLGIDFFEL